MFTKIKADVLKERENDKSWYRDAENESDLFVWQGEDGNVQRFQLWHKNDLLEWNQHGGFKSGSLTGEVGAFKSYQAPSYHYHSKFKSALALKMTPLIRENISSENEDVLLRKIAGIIRDAPRIF